MPLSIPVSMRDHMRRAIETLIETHIDHTNRSSLPNPSWQYDKRQIRVDEIENCLNEGLKSTYHFTILIDRQIVRVH